MRMYMQHTFLQYYQTVLMHFARARAATWGHKEGVSVRKEHNALDEPTNKQTAHAL